MSPETKSGFQRRERRAFLCFLCVLGARGDEGIALVFTTPPFRLQRSAKHYPHALVMLADLERTRCGEHYPADRLNPFARKTPLPELCKGLGESIPGFKLAIASKEQEARTSDASDAKAPNQEA